VNERRWFTAREISGFLEMPLSTVQVALRDLLRIAPSVWSLDKEREGKGRPEKSYSFQRFIPSTE
jgi:predicted Co/Zn/Cd cation transporter (cation efflux family)